MKNKAYDFGGYATRNNKRCTDGRTILMDAFRHCDGQRVPLVWQHGHDNIENILGYADLENRKDGVYARCKFNDTNGGISAKKQVAHGDINSLSIFASGIEEDNGNVSHGTIQEVSLVVSGANPGAFIEEVYLSHTGSAIGSTMYFGEELKDLQNEVIKHEDSKDEPEKEDKESKDKTIGEILAGMTEEQKEAVSYIALTAATEAARGDKKDKDKEDDKKEDGESKEDKSMKHNAFEGNNQEVKKTLSHAQIKETLEQAYNTNTSVKKAFLAHKATYGVDQIETLFPDAKNINNTPDFISRPMGWVSGVLNGVRKTPFSRIKSIHANITEDEARALGYMKGKLKKEEVFTLLKRTTEPTTIYKKQKIDRDDQIDITDFDVIRWLKGEMRTMLDEEIARAILVGDGRSTSSDDKISADKIRPVHTDADLYTIKAPVEHLAAATSTDKAKAFIVAAIKSRAQYKGSGSPVLYTTENVLTDIQLLEDTTGRQLYESTEKIKQMLKVSDIVTVPVMENITRTDSNSKVRSLMGIIVNLSDYAVGADKGGQVSLFDDFDIDYNQYKYLIETRCSGALTRPYSAIALEALEVAQISG